MEDRIRGEEWIGGVSAISDKELRGLLMATLTELYGVHVWWEESGVYHISACGKDAVVTRDEILAQQTSCEGFINLLKEKINPSIRENS